ncbi:MAG: TonB-dependent receptor [Gemmatimonadaceae bacterium]
MTPVRQIVRAVLGAGAALVVSSAASAQSHTCSSPGMLAGDTIPKWASPLDRRITLHANELSLRDALGRVAATARVRLSYSAELLPLDRAVCVSADATPLGEVLSELLEGVNVTPVAAAADQIVLAPRAPSPARRDSQENTSPAPEMLDRVVVTGSAIGAPERELTVGLDVVNGRQLSRDNTNTVSNALDGSVPGVWTWAQSPSSMVTSYASFRGASSFGLSYPKIYIDGIEVANPLLVTRFAPETIDRIEVIRGPQGSALYGTDAISGVINIVTRHEGADAEGQHTVLRTSAGMTQSAFAHNVLTQEHALSFVTGSSTRSADLNITGGSTGDFVPNGYSRDLLATASARVVGERTTLSGTARLFTETAGAATSPLLARYTVNPLDTSAAGRALRQQATAPQSIHQYTLASTATLSSSERWTHTFVAGIDGYRLANVETSFTAIPSVADSALRAAQGGADRATFRASSVFQLNGGEPTHATFTVSAEHAVLREATQYVESPPDDDHMPEAPARAYRAWEPARAYRAGAPAPVTTTNAAGVTNIVSWQNSTGITTQMNASLNEKLFFTGGLRVERDSRLVGEDEIATLPMVGLSAVNEFGPLSVKLRAAYGRGVRPPSTVSHAGFWQTRSTSPTQPTLGAERQEGTEAGLDVVFAHVLSFKVTRFDQRASGLIQQVAIPSDTTGMSRRMTYALENVGEITNKGWELEGSTNFSRLAITGTWSSVDSRVAKLATGYTGDLTTGDRMLQVPAGTGSLNVGWLATRWHASLSASRAFDWINYDELALGNAYLSGDHSARDLSGPQLRKYWRQYTGGTRLRASASRDIRGQFAIDVSAENLLNYQVNEPDNITVVPGRTIMTGLRVKF